MLKWLISKFSWLSEWKPPFNRVNMEAQRIRLEDKQLKVDAELEELAPKEKQLIDDGAATKSVAVQKQLASKLIRLRREMRRLSTLSGMYTKQMQVLESQVHNQILKEEGLEVDLPTADEMTQTAADAEHVIAELDVKADLARQIEVHTTGLLAEEEEAAVLEEFRQLAGEKGTATDEQIPNIDPNPCEEKPVKGRVLEYMPRAGKKEKIGA